MPTTTITTQQCVSHTAPTFINSTGKKIHTLPKCGLVTIQIARHILCSINFWCNFGCQGVFFLTNAVYTMYHSQNSSFITLLRFEESSISEVLVWQCNTKTMQNPTIS